MTDYARVLREDAERFVMTVAVVADEEDRLPQDVADEAIRHALARLTESGALGTSTE